MGRPLKNVHGCQTKAEYEHAKTCWIKFLKSKGIYRKKEGIKDLPLIDEEIQEVPIEPKMEIEDDSSQMKSHDLNLEVVIEDDGIDVPLDVLVPEIELELPKFKIDDSNTTEAFPTSSAVDQEKKDILMELKSADEQNNHESVEDLSEFDEEIQQCSIKCSKCGEVYSDPKVLSKHLFVCRPPRGNKAVEKQSSFSASSKPPKKEPSFGDTTSSASSSSSTRLSDFHVNNHCLYEDGTKDLPAFDVEIQEVPIEPKMEPDLKVIRELPRQVEKPPINCSICGSHCETLTALNINILSKHIVECNPTRYNKTVEEQTIEPSGGTSTTASSSPSTRLPDFYSNQTHENNDCLYEDSVKDLSVFDEEIQEVPIESKRIRGLPKQMAKTPISCSICGSHWETLSALNVHMRVHTGEKSYKCYICGKGYRQKASLKVDFFFAVS